jgi:hypothetical protein
LGFRVFYLSFGNNSIYGIRFWSIVSNGSVQTHL